MILTGNVYILYAYVRMHMFTKEVHVAIAHEAAGVIGFARLAGFRCGLDTSTHDFH